MFKISQKKKNLSKKGNVCLLSLFTFSDKNIRKSMKKHRVNDDTVLQHNLWY